MAGSWSRVQAKSIVSSKLDRATPVFPYASACNSNMTGSLYSYALVVAAYSIKGGACCFDAHRRTVRILLCQEAAEATRAS